MKTALIMEGGAMRGMFTCGVTDVLMENGISFDGAAGISAGAVFGCNYKSRQPGRAIRYNKKYCADPRYAGLSSLLKTGNLFGVDFCYHEIPDILDPFDRAAFKENPLEFYVGATDVETGEIRYHKCSDGGATDLTWMRGSASMPLVSSIVEVDGFKLLDGGIVDSIPYKFMESLGYNRNLVILTQPKGYRKEKSRLLVLSGLALRKYPRLREAIALRHERYNEQTAYVQAKEAAGEALAVYPPEPLHIGHTEKNPAELERVYQTGRRTAEQMLPRIKAFLGQ